MKKYTQKELKTFARDGIAQDITTMNFEQMKEFLHTHNLDRVGVSRGVYGLNGGLLKDIETGEFYVITTRNSALAMAF